MRDENDLFREILHRTTARYLTVRPEGLLLDGDDSPRKFLDVRIFSHGASRTLYRGRKPFCRSLDAVKSITHSDRRCQSCFERKHCTPQVRADLLHNGDPYRLLLSYTSAKNFLLYWNGLGEKGSELGDVITRILVVNRGSWGEARFNKRCER